MFEGFWSVNVDDIDVFEADDVKFVFNAVVEVVPLICDDDFVNLDIDALVKIVDEKFVVVPLCPLFYYVVMGFSLEMMMLMLILL